MEVLSLILGCLSLLFGALAGMTYYRLKQFLELITEDQLESAMPIIEKQKRRIYTFLIVCTVMTIATMVVSFCF